MSRPKARRALRSLAVAALAAILLLPADGGAEEAVERGTAQRVFDGTFDVLFLRSSGFVVLATGAALFVPAAVLTSPGGTVTIGEALERFVTAPSNYVFRRPIGEF